MADEIKAKLATAVILWLQTGVTRSTFVFPKDNFGKHVEVTFEVTEEGVLCDAGSGS